MMWAESSFDADGHRVRVSVRRLEGDQRERVAAEMAWFAHYLITPGVDLEAIGWIPFLQRILLDDVALTVDEDVVDRLESMWDEVVWRTLGVFYRGESLGSDSEAPPAFEPPARKLTVMTIYANVVNVRAAGKDLVLEFGSFFPQGDQRFPPGDHPPEVRVVISQELVEPLVDILRER